MVEHKEVNALLFKTELPHLAAASKISPGVFLPQLQLLQRGLDSLLEEADACREDELAQGRNRFRSLLEQERQQELEERLIMDLEDVRHSGEHSFEPHLWRGEMLSTQFGMGIVIDLNADKEMVCLKLPWGALLFTHKDEHPPTCTNVADGGVGRRGSDVKMVNKALELLGAVANPSESSVAVIFPGGIGSGVSVQVNPNISMVMKSIATMLQFAVVIFISSFLCTEPNGLG